MKKLLTIILSVVSFSALAAWQGSPMTTNKAAAYATTGQAPVFNGTQWVFVNTNAFGSGAGATNLTPWTTDINGASFSLTNAGSVHSTNFVGNGSGLTNIPGSGLQSPLNVSNMNVGTLTATNTFLTNGYYFHTNATTGQWGYWDTNGIHFESNFLSGVWWWRGPTNSMSGVAATTNSQTSAVDGSTTNSGPIKASKFYGDGSGLTGVSGGQATNAIMNVFTNGTAIAPGGTIITNINFNAGANVTVTGYVATGQANIGIASTASGGGGSVTNAILMGKIMQAGETYASATAVTNWTTIITNGDFNGSPITGTLTNGAAGYYEFLASLSYSNNYNGTAQIFIYTNGGASALSFGAYISSQNAGPTLIGGLYINANNTIDLRGSPGTLNRASYLRVQRVQ